MGPETARENACEGGVFMILHQPLTDVYHQNYISLKTKQSLWFWRIIEIWRPKNFIIIFINLVRKHETDTLPTDCTMASKSPKNDSKKADSRGVCGVCMYTFYPTSWNIMIYQLMKIHICKNYNFLYRTFVRSISTLE